MKILIGLTLFCLTFINVFAQQKIWIENIQFYSISLGRQEIKSIQVEGTQATVYLTDDVIRIKVSPSKTAIYDSDENEVISLGNISMSSEKERVYSYGITLTFDLTDGTIKHPCLFSPSNVFRFLNTDNAYQLLGFNEERTNATKVTVIKERFNTIGEVINLPIKVTWVAERLIEVRTLRSVRSVMNQRQVQNRIR